MPDKDKSPEWAGKGFSKRNSESAPEPKQPKLRAVPKPEPKEDEDPEAWIWK